MTAKELLSEYLENIQNPQKEAELFAEDGAIELPYFKSVNIPPRYKGKQQIETFISDLLKQAPTFKFINIKVLIDTPEQVFAEYEVNTILMVSLINNYIWVDWFPKTGKSFYYGKPVIPYLLKGLKFRIHHLLSS